jgi:hypothetical protein
MDWARILAYVTGTVYQKLLARNEYLAAENRIIKAQLKGRLKLSDTERGVLGEIGHRLGRKDVPSLRAKRSHRPIGSVGRKGDARVNGLPESIYFGSNLLTSAAIPDSAASGCADLSTTVCRRSLIA